MADTDWMGEIAAQITDHSFRKQRWQNQPALRSPRLGEGYLWLEYKGGEYDPNVWELIPEGWDHEHWIICCAHLCNYEECGFPEAYVNNSGEWVCPPCYERYFQSSE